MKSSEGFALPLPCPSSTIRFFYRALPLPYASSTMPFFYHTLPLPCPSSTIRFPRRALPPPCLLARAYRVGNLIGADGAQRDLIGADGAQQESCRRIPSSQALIARRQTLVANPLHNHVSEFRSHVPFVSGRRSATDRGDAVLVPEEGFDTTESLQDSF